MSRVLTRTVHAVEKPPVALSARNARGETGIVRSAGGTKIDTKELLANQTIPSPRIPGTTGSPWRTSAGAASVRFGNTGNQYHENQEVRVPKSFHYNTSGEFKEVILHAIESLKRSDRASDV